MVGRFSEIKGRVITTVVRFSEIIGRAVTMVG